MQQSKPTASVSKPSVSKPSISKPSISKANVPIINWGVLGCGHIAQTFMAGIADVKNAHVIACAASDATRAADFASTFNIQAHYASYIAMLQQRNIHAVYIATTHNFHFEHIMLCLAHGKHVLCEKPLTLNAQQAQKAYDLAREHNLLLVEAVWTRFLPAIRALQNVLQEGVIGNVQGMQVNFSINRDVPNTHRLKNQSLAGGALLDLGIYPITIADIVFDKTPVNIQSHCIKANTGVDQNSFYTLVYDSGAVAQLSAGFNMSGPIFANIMGDKGFIHVPFFLGAKSFSVTLEGEEPKDYVYDFESNQNFTFEITHMTQILLKGLYNIAHSNIVDTSVDTHLNVPLASQISDSSTLASDTLCSDIMPASTTLRVMSIMDTIREQWGLRYENENV